MIKAHNTRERMKQMDAIEARKKARRDEQATRFHRTVGLPLQHPGGAKAEPTAEKKKEDQKPSDSKPSDASSTHLSDTGVDGVVVPAEKTSKYFENGEEVSAGVSVHAVKDEKPDLDDFRFNPGGSGASSGADERDEDEERERERGPRRPDPLTGHQAHARGTQDLPLQPHAQPAAPGEFLFISVWAICLTSCFVYSSSRN